VNMNFLLRYRECVGNTRAPAVVGVGFVASPEAMCLFLESCLGSKKKHVRLCCKNMATIRNLLKSIFRSKN
jgi:hypothetical protein